VLHCDGRDISKKSTHRKGRYLLSFPGMIEEITASGGPCGRLEAMDTPNPVFVMDFPEVSKLFALGAGVGTACF
jgi:hypothetical protein